MKPRYAIIDEEERDEFEKEFQLPYGYGDSFIAYSFEEAIMEMHFLMEQDLFFSVERIDEYGREIVYR
jgi:hypothetical protein